MKFLNQLLSWPLLGAPMAGGPSLPALTAAVSDAGALGFLAAGYRSLAQLTGDIEEVRRRTSRAFGVNLFVPQPIKHPEALRSYLDELSADAAALGAGLGEPVWDDDCWSDKLDLLEVQRVPLVSFTFGCPPSETIARLQACGAQVIVTSTTPAEARLAATAGADALCLQGIDAGGHQGCFSDDVGPDAGWGLLALISAVRSEVDLPLVAAGGIMNGRDVAAVVAAGAAVAQLGTALLRSHESGTSGPHRAALSDPQRTETGLTRAFSGRRARGLVNAFMERHPNAPSGYPYVNNATRPLRQAALAAHDAEGINLWAGRGFRQSEERLAAEIIGRIGAEYQQTVRELATIVDAQSA